MAAIFIDTGRDFKECYFCLGDLHYARPDNVGHKIQMNGSMVFY